MIVSGATSERVGQTTGKARETQGPLRDLTGQVAWFFINSASWNQPYLQVSGCDSGLNHQPAQGRERSIIVWLKKINSELRLPTFMLPPSSTSPVSGAAFFISSNLSFPICKMETKMWPQEDHLCIEFTQCSKIECSINWALSIECSKMLSFMYFFKEILTCIKVMIYAPNTCPGNSDHLTFQASGRLCHGGKGRNLWWDAESLLFFGILSLFWNRKCALPIHNGEIWLKSFMIGRLLWFW